MALVNIADELYKSFLEKSADARVVLLHADGRYRPVLLSKLLSSPELKIFYYAMGPDDIDTVAFLSGFTHDMAEQVPNFGGRINHLGFNIEEGVDTLVDAMVADLNELSDSPFLLILDEFDQADIADDLQVFIERLVDRLPPQCKLVLSSRQLPRLPWVSMIAQNKAIMLRDSELVSNNFYQKPFDGEPRVQVHGLGPGHVVLDGETVNTWEGHLPRLLFFFCLDRPMVTRSEICRAFWPDLDNDQAVNVFHVTKRRLHKALEPVGLDVLIHSGGYYRINPELTINYDIFDFVSALVTGRQSEGKDRIKAWQRALDLYSRPFLQGHTEGWITKRREEYLTGYLEALTNIAQLRLEDNRPEQALSLLLKAVQENPLRQDLHRQVMSLYSQLGRRSETAGHFRKLEQTLKDAKVALEPETTELFNELVNS